MVDPRWVSHGCDCAYHPSDRSCSDRFYSPSHVYPYYKVNNDSKGYEGYDIYDATESNAGGPRSYAFAIWVKGSSQICIIKLSNLLEEKRTWPAQNMLRSLTMPTITVL